MNNLYSRLKEFAETILAPDDMGIFHSHIDRLEKSPLKLVRFIPEKTLAVSLTGEKCGRRCRHCMGHYLSGMKPLASLTAEKLSKYSSVLISGGSDDTGKVPIGEYIDRINKIPTDLRLNIHVGLQGAHDLLSLRNRETTISFDLIGCDETIKEVYGLDRHASDYKEAYLELTKYFSVIPHLTVGLRGGKPSGEIEILNFLKNNPSSTLTFLVFRPTPNTPYQGCSPPAMEYVVNLIARAVSELSSVVSLGCMRPSGSYRKRLDLLAWIAGARSIVLPDKSLTDFLSGVGFPVETSYECCSLRTTETANGR